MVVSFGLFREKVFFLEFGLCLCFLECAFSIENFPNLFFKRDSQLTTMYTFRM